MLSEYMNEANAQLLLEFIPDYRKLFSEDEYFYINSNQNESEKNPLSLIINVNDKIYYINLKKITLFFICSLIDIKLNFPIMNLLIELTDNSIQKYKEISESNGELCIYMEIRNREGTAIKFSDFLNCQSECINNNLSCSHNIDGKCKLTSEKFADIINKFLLSGIFSLNNEKYQYNI